MHFAGFPNRFEFSHIFIREFLPDLLKVGHGLRCVQTLPAVQADFRLHPQNGSIRPAPEELFNLFICKFTPADRAFFK
jgi:hypothetical protein